MITFRKATFSDIPMLIEFDSLVKSEMYSAYETSEEWLKELRESRVYIIHDELRGNIGMFSVQEKNKVHVYFARLVVHPQCRRRGAADKAVKYAISLYPNAERIDLVTHPQNSSAIMLYLKNGFVIESWKENYYGDGQPRIVMARIKE